MAKAPDYQYATRLNSFKARPDLYSWKFGPSDTRDLIHRADGVTELNSVVLNYPEHFTGLAAADIAQCLAETHLSVSGINMRYSESTYLDGAFTNPDPELRRSAIKLTLEGADLCRQLGGSHLIVWPGQDGYDYPFQMDYFRTWDWEMEGLKAVAEYAPELKICIEYKPADPRRYSVLGNVGSSLLAIEECGAPNLGVLLDFCHQLMAAENPAFSAALCIRKKRLFGIHLNDGYGSMDDGLLIGSVNFSKTAELLHYVAHSDYSGVIYFDTFPKREDPVKECSANILRVKQLLEMIERMDAAGIQEAMQKQDGLGAAGILWQAMRP